MSTDTSAPTDRGGPAVNPEDQPYRIMLRPIANPLPISLCGLLIVTSTVAALQLGLIPTGQEQVVGRAVIAVALVLQLPGAFFGVLARDPAAGTGMAILGATWLIVGISLAFTPAAPSSAGLGMALLAAGAALLVPIAASTAKPVTILVLVTCLLRFEVTGISELTGSPAWQTAAGVLGFVLGAVALYAAMAFQLEDVHHKAVLPLGRRGPAARAMESGTREQLRGIESEAGVRQQL